MHELGLHSLKAALLVAIPFLVILLLSLFRLNALFHPSRRAGTPHRPPCGIDENGEPLLVDPDGRIALPRPKHRREPPEAAPTPQSTALAVAPRINPDLPDSGGPDLLFQNRLLQVIREVPPGNEEDAHPSQNAEKAEK